MLIYSFKIGGGIIFHSFFISTVANVFAISIKYPEKYLFTSGIPESKSFNKFHWYLLLIYVYNSTLSGFIQNISCH